MSGPKQPKDYIIFPLDVDNLDQTRGLIEELKDDVGLFKIGLQLFVKEGPAAVDAVRRVGGSAKIFLDLKFHDIPATVKGAYASASRLGAEFVTVHCDEGKDLLRAVVEAGEGRTKVLGITVLTSLAAGDLGPLGFREEFQKDLGLLAVSRARLAREAGCAGVVCSGKEAARIKQELGPDFLVVTPGIRPAWSLVAGDDQKRVTTAADAVKAGADYIVIGRPIRDAKDRAEAARRVAQEIEEALY